MYLARNSRPILLEAFLRHLGSTNVVRQFNLQVDALGIFAWACSGALLSCGSSWVAEWCAKSLAPWLLQPLYVAVSDVLGFVADNLAASFGSRGGKPPLCVWVDALRLDYASLLADGLVPEFFVP